MGHVHIRSAKFPNVHVRLEANDVKRHTDDGSGTANGQFGAGAYETFTKIDNPDGTISFKSMVFDNVFLRMNATGVHGLSAPGGGIVNGQYDAGPWERFKLMTNPDGTFALKSGAFEAFLRIDGTGVTAMTGSGGGTVNCQGTVGEYEKLTIVDCLMESQVSDAIDWFARNFPADADTINMHRQHIINACCPPFNTSPPPGLVPPPPHHHPMSLQGGTAVSDPCQAALNAAMWDILSAIFTLAGLTLSARVRANLYELVPAAQIDHVTEAFLMLQQRWNLGGVERAHAIYDVFSILYSCGSLFVEAFHDIYDHMSWWDWIVTGVKALATIATWAASGGWALIAELVLLAMTLNQLRIDAVEVTTKCILPGQPGSSPLAPDTR